MVERPRMPSENQTDARWRCCCSTTARGNTPTRRRCAGRCGQFPRNRLSCLSPGRRRCARAIREASACSMRGSRSSWTSGRVRSASWASYTARHGPRRAAGSPTPRPIWIARPEQALDQKSRIARDGKLADLENRRNDASRPTATRSSSARQASDDTVDAARPAENALPLSCFVLLPGPSPHRRQRRNSEKTRKSGWHPLDPTRVCRARW